MSGTVIETPVKQESVPTIKTALSIRNTQLLCAAVSVALLIAYYPALLFWWSRWFEPESYYSHGPFVPLASIFIIWFNRRPIGRIKIAPNYWGFAIMGLAVSAGWFAWMGASASVMGFTLPVYLIGAIIAVFGTAAAREFIVPVFLLYFAAVLPESLLTALSFKAQMLSVKVAVAGLNIAGMDATARGAFIDMPGITVEVANACSGFRLVVSMLAIASFFAYIRRGPLSGKTALILFAVPLGIVINSVRIIITAYSGHLWGEDVLKQVHDWAGMAVLFVCAGVLLLFARVVGCGNYKEMPS